MGAQKFGEGHKNGSRNFVKTVSTELGNIDVLATCLFRRYLSGIVATENVRPMLSCKVTAKSTFIPRGNVCSFSEFALTGD